MPQYRDYFFEGDFNIRRKRILDHVDGRMRDLNKLRLSDEEESQRFINNVFSAYERASDKANIIIKNAARVADKYTITVPVESNDVRMAVHRQDPEGSNRGEFLTFELFTRCADKIEDQATRVSFDLVDTRVSVDPVGNELRVRGKIDAEIANDGDLGFILALGAQFLTLYLIHEITGMWRGPEKIQAAQVAAGPLAVETATPFLETLREMAIGMAVGFTVMGINETLAFLLADQGADKSLDRDKFVQGAIGQASQVDLPPLTQTAIKAIGINDHMTIMKFAMKFVSATPDRGYEFWLAYMIARRTRYFSKRALSMKSIYSRKAYASKNLGFTSDGALIEPDDVVLQDPNLANSPGGTNFVEFLAAGVVSTLNSSVTRPHDSFLCVADEESSGFEDSLNEIAQVLDTKLVRDAICCLVRFLGNLDVSMLEKIAVLMRVYLNAQVNLLNLRIENFLTALLNWVKSTILRMIAAIIQQIIDKIARLILDLLLDLVEHINILMECPLIMDLINAILDAVYKILLDLEELINRLIIDVVLDGLLGLRLNVPEQMKSSETSSSGLYHVHKKRSINNILRILERILSTLTDSITICEDDEVEQLRAEGRQFITFDDLTDELTEDLNDYLDIPQDVKEAYFSDAKPIRLQDGSLLPDYRDGAIRLGTYTQSDPDVVLDCLPLFGSENIARILGENARRPNNGT